MENQTMIITLKEYKILRQICELYEQLLKEHDLLYDEYIRLLDERSKEKPKLQMGFERSK